MNIEVAFAEAHRQRVINLELADGGLVGEALERALKQWRLTLPEDCKVGIFGEVVSLERALREGDRVEIYRPLLLDPKAARLKRAQEQSSQA